MNFRANTSEENCTYNNEWQGYECHGYKHGILVIESMDEDSETRRISPVALASNGYVDLFNGIRSLVQQQLVKRNES